MTTNPVAADPSSSVLFLSRDRGAIGAIRSALALNGLALEAADSVAELGARLSGRGDPAARPALILVDMGALSEPEEIGVLALTLAALGEPAVPLVCLAADLEIGPRLAALRSGVADYLETGTGPLQVATRIRLLVGRDEVAPPRVLVVDDQPVAALFAARVLEGAGMVVERVGDPMEVLAALERFAPDLVVMDLHMPGASGIELTGIIREQERFDDLPILFVSGEPDPARQLDTLRLGGDDFLAKPVPPQLLVERVRRSLDAARRRAGRRAPLAGVDPHTGLATRERLLERLDRQIGTGQGAQSALIYLEQPGDEAALGRLAAEIAVHADPSDLLARVGEHGMAVLARRADPGALAGYGERLAKAVRRTFAGTDGPAMPLPIGVGWYLLGADDGEAVTLVSRARKAARASLRDGRGRLERYGEEPERSRGAQRDLILAAIEAEQLELLFQPMVDLSGSTRESYEATVRLRTADGELLGPAVFAPLALREGLSERIDRWVLAAGLDALAGCRGAGRSAQLFLHQSMASLGAEGWIDGLREGISTRDLIHLRPVIQLQVADADRNLDLAVERGGQLERLGIRLCLNGLGQGGRATRVVGSVPAAFARLAGEAALGLAPDRLKALVAWIHERGARVIVTGVDGPEAVARLYAARVDLVQGPYVQSPTEVMAFDFSGAECGG